jgi:hypothetical protein
MLNQSRGAHSPVGAVHHAAEVIIAFCGSTVGSLRHGYARACGIVRRGQSRTGQGSYPEELTEEQAAYIYRMAEDRRRDRELRLEKLRNSKL